MIQARCHCGAVEIEISQPPSEITECNCSICHRYGALWAYYDPSQVRVRAAVPTHIYMWDDQSLAFHRCGNCGCLTHWSPVNRAPNRMGVNARMMEPTLIAQAKVRHLDGRVTETYLD